jgi:hypothetical protein
MDHLLILLLPKHGLEPFVMRKLRLLKLFGILGQKQFLPQDLAVETQKLFLDQMLFRGVIFVDELLDFISQAIKSLASAPRLRDTQEQGAHVPQLSQVFN